jgi:hypothetical protein
MVSKRWLRQGRPEVMQRSYSMVILSGLVVCFGACGRAPLVGAHGGAAGVLGLGGATSTGGARAVGGASGAVGPSGTGGATTTDTTCVAVSQVPANAVAICSFTGGYDEAYGCDKLPVRMATDSTSYYFATNAGQTVARCPRDRANPVAILSMETYSDGVYHLLSGEILPSGLISLSCTIRDPAGPGSGYWYACSADGIQIIQPDPKSGNLYVQLRRPGPDAGDSGYEGHFDGYAQCLRGEWQPFPITYTSMSEGGTVLGEQPIACSVEKQAVTFMDLDGRLVTISFGENYRVTDVQLQPAN